jgi:hypothetical protein
MNMSAERVDLKKLVVEFRYRPTLNAYSGMDKIGLGLAKDFPDWQRTPLALEIRNKVKHRRLGITFNRTVFDSYAPEDVSRELSLARECVTNVTKRLKVTEFQRFGMRSLFVAETGETFERLVQQVAKNFLAPIGTIGAFGDMTLKDVAYVVDVHFKEWTYCVKVGPVEKKQWLSLVQHGKDIFESEPGGETFEKFRDSIPDRFVFLDIDASREGVLESDVLKTFRGLHDRSRKIAEDLLKHCWR